MADKTASAGASKKPKKANNVVGKDYNLKKRPPQKPLLAENVFYVSVKSNTKGLLDRCSKLIAADTTEIVVYCLGAAIQRGILLALQICEKHPTFQISTNTLTTELIDDLEPATDEADYEIQKRLNSGLRIIVARKDPLNQSNSHVLHH